MLHHNLLLISLHLHMGKHLLVIRPYLEPVVDHKLWLKLVEKQQFVVDLSHMVLD
jgi:hypothetical protein